MNGYYICGNCEKTHKGVYRKPVIGATSDQNTTPEKDWMIKKATQNYIKTMVASESKKKIQKGKRKRRYSSDSSSSESTSSDGESWRSGMSGAEQIHMLASAGINPNDSDIEFQPEDERCYKNTLRKFEHGLFGGGLGKLRNCKPTHIKLKPRAIPYKGRYSNVLLGFVTDLEFVFLSHYFN